jgi:hypothetical protein
VSVWIKPDQLDALRTAVYRCRPDYLQERDDTILTLMYDTGIRVGELVAIDTELLRDTPIDTTHKAIYYEDGEAVEIFDIFDVADYEGIYLLAEDADMSVRKRIGLPPEALEGEINE